MSRLLTTLILAMMVASHSMAAEPAALVATRTLLPGPVELTLSPKVGRLQAIRERKLAFEVAGRLESLAAEGSVLSAGELVASLDSDLEEARLRQSELRLVDAQSELKRVRGLIQANAASQKMLESAETLEALRRAERDEARVLLDKRTLLAAFDGVVVATSFEVGEVLSPAAVLCVLMDLKELRLELAVPGYELVQVSTGARVSVTVPALPTASFKGVVERVAVAAPEGRHLFEVEVRIPNPSGVARPGMSARASIVKAQIDSAVSLPALAAVERHGVSVIYVVENGAAREISAQAATADGDRLILPIEGRSRELVVRGQRGLRDGMSVTVDNTVLEHVSR